MGKFIQNTLIIMLLCTYSFSSYANLIFNGDFELGLSGWTLLNPSGSDAGTRFTDMDGAGPLPPSIAFAGQAAGGFSSERINLYQQVDLIEGGDYIFSADIAVSTVYANTSAGTISIWLGNTLITFHNFGSINDNQRKVSSFLTVFNAKEEIIFNVQFYRPFISTPNTPYLYIDNIKIVPVSNNLPTIPEPATLPLLAISLLFALHINSTLKKRKTPEHIDNNHYTVLICT